MDTASAIDRTRHLLFLVHGSLKMIRTSHPSGSRLMHIIRRACYVRPVVRMPNLRNHSVPCRVQWSNFQILWLLASPLTVHDMGGSKYENEIPVPGWMRQFQLSLTD